MRARRREENASSSESATTVAAGWQNPDWCWQHTGMAPSSCLGPWQHGRGDQGSGSWMRSTTVVPPALPWRPWSRWAGPCMSQIVSAHCLSRTSLDACLHEAAIAGRQQHHGTPCRQDRQACLRQCTGRCSPITGQLQSSAHLIPSCILLFDAQPCMEHAGSPGRIVHPAPVPPGYSSPCHTLQQQCRHHHTPQNSQWDLVTP